MSKDYDYLSDQELDSLIESVEAEGLVSAPEDFMTEVLDNIVEIDKYRITAVPEPSNKNILDYSIYCIKVFGSIAAAILIMVMVPFIRGAEQIPDRTEVVSHISVPTKEDVVSQKPVKSKEEVLNKQTQATDIITDLETWFDSLPISK
jgi:hypothetical protein